MQSSLVLAIGIGVLFIGLPLVRPSIRRLIHHSRRRHYHRRPLSIELRHLAPSCRPNRHRC